MNRRSSFRAGAYLVVILQLAGCGGGSSNSSGSGGSANSGGSSGSSGGGGGGGGGSSGAGINYFSWGAETNAPLFGGTTRDCNVAHSGACSMRLNVIGNDGGNQQMGVDGDQITYPFNFVGAPAIYYRWWMRIQPGFRWGNGTAKAKSSRVLATATSEGYTGYISSDGFLIGECDAAGCRLNDGSINTDSNLIIPYNFRNADDGQWHEYIVKVKPNTNGACVAGSNCDAQFEAWVDGVSVGQYNNFKLHTNAGDGMVEAWGGWMQTPYFQLNGTASDGGVIYVDDISTDSNYNSLIGP